MNSNEFKRTKQPTRMFTRTHTHIHLDLQGVWLIELNSSVLFNPQQPHIQTKGWYVCMVFAVSHEDVLKVATELKQLNN